MPKVKIAKKSVLVDMTAMCDVSFLLLTFFILTAKFRPAEAVVVDTPASRAEQKVPEDLITITVDSTGAAFIGISDTLRRENTLNSMIERYGDKYPVLKELTPSQKAKFKHIGTIGVKVSELPSLLNLSLDKVALVQLKGVPMDSTDNQLGDWVNSARATGVDEGIDVPIAIKGDKTSNVVAVKEVIETLRKREIYRFNLITSLEVSID